MVIGKTFPSISKAEIFSQFSEAQVLSAVFPEIHSIPCRISSPFRVDKNPSFSIYMTEGKHIYYKDFGDSSDKGSLMDLLCKYWKCTFNQALDKIGNLLIQKEGVKVKTTQLKVLTRKESQESTKIQVAVRPWKAHDLEYWASYGVEKQWLKYAEIYPISHKIVTKKDNETGKQRKYIFSSPKYCYCYTERKRGILSLKIYSPLSKTHKWCSKMDASVISLWTKVPEYGDRIIIASSTKDALAISCNLHIPAIALQGEGYNISNTAINELKRRYKKVYISFDGDDAGKEYAKKLSESTGFEIISCPTIKTPKQNREVAAKLIKEGLQKKDTAKDWSDIFLYFGKERFMQEFANAFSS